MARRTVRRRRATAGAEPPADALDERGRIPLSGDRAERFLAWLRSQHPEIDPVDDLITSAILDDLDGQPAAVVVAAYCNPAAHR